MKKVKYPNLNDYDLSAYEELKGDVLYKINGGTTMSSADQQAMAEAGKNGDAQKQAEIKAKYETKDSTSTSTSTGSNGLVKPAPATVSTAPTQTDTPAQSTALDHGQQADMAKQDAERKTGGAGSSAGSYSGGGYSGQGGSSGVSGERSSSVDRRNYVSALDHGQQSGMNIKGAEKNLLSRQKVLADSYSELPDAPDYPGWRFDSHNPKRIIAELDNPNALGQALDILSDSYLGYTVTAHSSKSGETKEFRNYSELYDYLYSGTGDTVSAVMHYFNPFNKGAAVRVGKKAFDNVKRENNKIFEERIKSGLTESSNGNYSLNMVSKENPTRRNDFFIGTTRIDYEIITGEKNSAVKFTAFSGDGFWDVRYWDEDRIPADGTGPNLELPFGKVYPFETRSWTETFGNPPVMNWLRENENE
ncbi:MAG: hypothetical protein ILP07_09585 [Treponema sp.]|nr:hypothetical protein [Treponema sp.]